MSHIYLMKSDIKLGFREGQMTIADLGKGTKREMPFSTVESISVFGQAQLSTQLIRECIARDVPIIYYSDDGHYFGKVESFDRIDPIRHKMQMYASDDSTFSLGIARSIVDAKVRNSLTYLLRRSDVYVFTDKELQPLGHSIQRIQECTSIDELMGYEGNAARTYFQCLSRLLPDEFAFSGRSARPPKDPFNSMLSFGYSIYFRTIIGAIERAGLHPYFSFLHQLKFGHAALASDLIEAFRAPVIDAAIVDFAWSGDVHPNDFYHNDAGAVYMKRGVAKELSGYLSGIALEKHAYYLHFGDRRKYSFRVALDTMIRSLIIAIEQKDPSLYLPFLWVPEDRD
ncbi:CRISPR-associated endonuclease Cas1 [Olsenella sp. An290]|nr:CRISPR-associated endonuclease Cas1 [Olsenella sp. An290]